ncbi:hypothetical protein N7449_004860 [Penicillium cf. viridicatum]|uniref:Uncharacterized protein n=1 Tax=Penicillium cf. viridicatum TaxID=2972119 RepID=A0A9W9MK09_9EURO|nr:hypothetical protein N7449_004860 [Penicillium cf. viridicatum]
MLQAENDEEVITFVLKPNKDQNEEKVPNDDIDAEMAKLIDVKNHPTGELLPNIDEVAVCDSMDSGD